MDFIKKQINSLIYILFDVTESDHGDSGWQWYYGILFIGIDEYPFSICVMHEPTSGTESFELTFTEDIPENQETLTNQILAEFDWSDINDQHEQNELEWLKTQDKIRNENF